MLKGLNMTNFMQDIECCQPIALELIESWEQQNNGMRVQDYFEAPLNQTGTISFKQIVYNIVQSQCHFIQIVSVPVQYHL